jgi:2-dehydro-3-deoxygluconokinase
MITTFGEIMLRINPSLSGERIIQANNFRITPGGSESNVAIALASLGMQSAFVTRLPENELAQMIIQQLKMLSVDTSQILIKGDRVGMYWTETGTGPRNSFVIYDREHSAFSLSVFDDYDFSNLLSSSSWFHFSGISPAVSELVAILLKRAVQTCSCPYSVDLNFREKLWNWLGKDKANINEVMSGLCERATLIAGNESDFQQIFGINSTAKDINRCYTEIAEKCFKLFPTAKYISISNRASLSATINNWSGFLFVRDDKQFAFKGADYSIDHIQDRVGTGDSFVAGVIFGLNNLFRFSFQETIDFAVALSALNHTTLGDASYFNENDVLKVIKSKGSGRIIR